MILAVRKFENNEKGGTFQTTAQKLPLRSFRTAVMNPLGCAESSRAGWNRQTCVGIALPPLNVTCSR